MSSMLPVLACKMLKRPQHGMWRFQTANIVGMQKSLVRVPASPASPPPLRSVQWLAQIRHCACVFGVVVIKKATRQRKIPHSAQATRNALALSVSRATATNGADLMHVRQGHL